MSARENIRNILLYGVDEQGELGAALDAYRAEVLREAAAAVDSGNTFPEPVRGGAAWAGRMLRRMADEAVR